MNEEKLVTVAAKLYEARRTMRAFYGARFADKIAEYKPYVLRVMAAKKCNEMQAGMEMINELKDQPECGMHCALLMATIVEMIEPS
jgi:hypothetical protein